jgi:hypothetical protein
MPVIGFLAAGSSGNDGGIRRAYLAVGRFCPNKCECRSHRLGRVSGVFSRGMTVWFLLSACLPITDRHFRNSPATFIRMPIVGMFHTSERANGKSAIYRIA